MEFDRLCKYPESRDDLFNSVCIGHFNFVNYTYFSLGRWLLGLFISHFFFYKKLKDFDCVFTYKKYQNVLTENLL